MIYHKFIAQFDDDTSKIIYAINDLVAGELACRYAAAENKSGFFVLPSLASPVEVVSEFQTNQIKPTPIGSPIEQYPKEEIYSANEQLVIVNDDRLIFGACSTCPVKNSCDKMPGSDECIDKLETFRDEPEGTYSSDIVITDNNSESSISPDDDNKIVIINEIIEPCATCHHYETGCNLLPDSIQCKEKQKRSPCMYCVKNDKSTKDCCVGCPPNWKLFERKPENKLADKRQPIAKRNEDPND